MSGDIPAGNLMEGHCYTDEKGTYLGKYQGKQNTILTLTEPKIFDYYFENGRYRISNDLFPLFKRAECETNSSSSSASANNASENSKRVEKFFSEYAKRFGPAPTPEGQVPYTKNNNTVSIHSNYKSNSNSNNTANIFNNKAAKAMVNLTKHSPTGKDLQALLQEKFGASSAAGKRKTRKRKMRTRRYGSRRR